MIVEIQDLEAFYREKRPCFAARICVFVVRTANGRNKSLENYYKTFLENSATFDE